MCRILTFHHWRQRKEHKGQKDQQDQPPTSWIQPMLETSSSTSCCWDGTHRLLKNKKEGNWGWKKHEKCRQCGKGHGNATIFQIFPLQFSSQKKGNDDCQLKSRMCTNKGKLICCSSSCYCFWIGLLFCFIVEWLRMVLELEKPLKVCWSCLCTENYWDSTMQSLAYRENRGNNNHNYDNTVHRAT